MPHPTKKRNKSTHPSHSDARFSALRLASLAAVAILLIVAIHRPATALTTSALPPTGLSLPAPASPALSPAVQQSQPAQHPLTSLPYTPSLDLASLDRTADACVDFYQYSCGGWMKNNPIPPDQAGWSVYSKLENENKQFLWGILQQAANTTANRTPNEQKIGDYFEACMAEAQIEKLGAAPLQPSLQEINALTDKSQLARYIARTHLSVGGSTEMQGGTLFGFSSLQNFADASQVIAFAFAGGLGLPDRDYYTESDSHMRDIRDKYVIHVRKTLELLGDPEANASQEAQTVLNIETELAKKSLTPVQMRNPYNLFHLMDTAQLQALTPEFNWNDYLAEIGASGIHSVNVTEPDFYRELNTLLQTVSLADWKTYLRWHLARSWSPYLSMNFQKESFDFYGHTLRGVDEMSPRWRKCIQWVDRDLDEALGQVFVAKTFSPDTKARTLEMTRQIEDAMQTDLKDLPWMSPETKKEAFAKLHAIVNKVGYPDKWRDYTALDVVRDDFAGNVNRSAIFESRRELNKIGQPVDRGEWSMSAITVDAYFDPQKNDINFPAGVLQPPLFDPKMDDAPNYGNTGSTIGHELTHCFDDEGRQFDSHGNLRDWWTKEDAAGFEERIACIQEQYSHYVVVDDVHINSKLTTGEDVADLGGLLLAYIAWKNATHAQDLKPIDGFTPDQRFFIGYGQWACENQRPENLRANALTNPHSPGKYRINGTVSDMPQFQQAFHCQAGQPMVRKKMCRVW